MNRLNDKVVLITDSTSEIGEECARLFADEGAKIILGSADVVKAEKIAQEIREGQGEAITILCDLNNPESAVELITDAVNEFGQLDILVNNLSYGQDEPFEADSAGQQIARAAVNEMHSAKAGTVVNVYSGAENACSQTAYPGLVNNTEHMATICSSSQIRVNALCTSNCKVIRSTEVEEIEESEGNLIESVIAENDQVSTDYSVEDITEIILFLASDESRIMTGQVLYCNCNFSED